MRFRFAVIGLWTALMGVYPFASPDHSEWTSTLMVDVIWHAWGMVICAIYTYDRGWFR